MHRTRLALALVALGLAGCTVGPDYVRPPVDAPAAFRFEAAHVAETADAEWWKQYGDPVLDRLIAQALEANRNVKIAAANVEAAAAIVTQARAPMFPQVGYGASAERARFSESGGSPVSGYAGNPRTLYQGSFTASWEIDLWGRIRRQTEAAQANLLGTEQARRGAILSLVANVASSYLQLRGLDEALEVAKKTQQVYGESLQIFRYQFEYGQVSQMNVAQAQSQYETASAQIPAIEQQIAQLENAISVLVGSNPGPIPRGKTVAELASPPVPAGLPSQLLERRPDVMQAEAQLVAANAQIGAAKALYFPTISLTGALGAASSDLSNLFKGPANTWSFAGSIVGPIFTAGLVSGQVAQAEATQQAALFGYEQTIQAAFADVSNALVARQMLLEQVAAQERLVRALRDYSRLARLQYDGGYSPYSTVLQAEQSLFPAELTLATLRASAAGSVANLYKAMGGAWIDRADAMTGGVASGGLRQAQAPGSR
ncbi:MAG: efflux transporter outer membrane subunit [Burkholderiales bacterium]